MNTIFDPQVLADDLKEVRRVYTEFFSTLNKASWDKPVKGGPKEWSLHETVAHLVALDAAGLESVKHTLRGETYTFVGLDDRYKFNAYNRKGIDDYLNIPMEKLCADLLALLDEAARIAGNLRPSQAELSSQMPIYNRPVRIAEVFSILIFHIGLVHSSQVVEPAGLAPLWKQFSPEFLHRMVGRAMRAFSLLYRYDFGGALRATLVFRIDGTEGGEWYVNMSPEAATSGEEHVENPDLVIHLRKTGVFCKMLTHRLNLPLALLSGDFKLRGDMHLFLRMDALFSVDARPKAAAKKNSANTQYVVERFSK